MSPAKRIRKSLPKGSILTTSKSDAKDSDDQLTSDVTIKDDPDGLLSTSDHLVESTEEATFVQDIEDEDDNDADIEGKQKHQDGVRNRLTLN